MKIIKTLPLILVGMIPLAAFAVPLAESKFVSTTEGWGTAGDAKEFAWQTGGYVQAKDKSLGDNWYFSASSAFLGNKATASDLSFDLQATSSSPYNAWDVVLAGAGITLAIDLSPNPNPTTWTHYSVALDSATSWKVIANNSFTTSFSNLGNASNSQLSSVLGALNGLYIRGEYQSGPDTGRLDNVVMSAALAPVPEPETYAMLLAGLGLMGLVARRRKQKLSI